MDSQPTAQPLLSDTANEWFAGQESFIGGVVAPVFQSGEQSGEYYVSEAENIVATADNIERAPGTPYKRVALRLADDSYSTKDRGIAVPIDDRMRNKYRNRWNQEEAAAQKGAMTVLTDREVRVAAMASDASLTHTAVTTWTASNGDTILSEVDAEIEAIRKASENARKSSSWVQADRC